MLDVFNNPNLIFVSFAPGAGGHKLARVLCTLPDVYWYSDEHNGKHPWNIHFSDSAVYQRKVASSHFDRIVNGQKLPPTWDYVKDFWPDEDDYYTNVFYPAFKKTDALEVLKTKRLVYCTHELPDKLLQRFPRAKVINILYNKKTPERYMRTTAVFPGYTKLYALNGHETEYGKYLQTVEQSLGLNFTVRDLWSFGKYQTGYSDAYEQEYKQYVTDLLNGYNAQRNEFTHNNVLSIHKKDYTIIKRFLNNVI